MPRPIQARIDIAALHHNLRVAQRQAPQSKVFAVIKANAYGHGLLRAAHAFEHAAGFALLNIEDAITLREAGFRQTILLLEGFFDDGDLRLIHEYRLATVVHSDEQLHRLMRASLPSGLDVHLKINTGMNRLGFKPQEVANALAALRQLRLGGLTLIAHFSTAEEPEGIKEQLRLFRAIAGSLPYPASLANSAALLRYPESHAQWVRPGIMLYGSSPFTDISARQLDLRPAMTLASELIAIQQLKPGDTVGYGKTFAAESSMRIGVVACGYADGYPRHAPTGTAILVEGIRARTVGRVAMDMLCVDLSNLPQARVGSPVTLWGEGLSVDEVASAAGTVSYELLTKVTQRVPVIEV